MAFPSIDITPFAQSANADVRTPFTGNERPNFYSTSNTSVLLDNPRPAAFSRRMLTWRTPHLGYVQMYINPQQLNIQEKKIITPTRTKGGYIIQYAAEDLINIAVRGTTGSSGMEGINVLRAIYRSEQDAFTGMAQSLEQKLASSQLYSLFKGTGTPQGAAQLQDVGTLLLEQSAKEAIFNIFDQPFPTLASLAASIELFFQGVLYKGFFTSFSVEESAESPGLFNYDLAFTAYSRQGVRRNFMPWHRQPYNPADVNANPLSFNGALEPLTVLIDSGSAPADTTPPPKSDTFKDENILFGKSDKVVRDTKFATFAGGKSVSDKDFLKNPPKING
jgi:hypothetical protein